MFRLALACFWALFVVCSVSFADTARVNSVRVWNAPDNTRVVFDLSGAIRHNVFTLSGPDRLVVDLPDARLATSTAAVDLGNSLISGVRTALREQGGLRIVFDLKGRIQQPKTFLLRPNDQYGHRLVVDLFPAGGQPVGQTVVQEPVPPLDRQIARQAVAPAATPPVTSQAIPQAAPPAVPANAPRVAAEPPRPREEPESKPVASRPVVSATPSAPRRELIIAIDAGHGGEDPGAVGPRKTREKDVVLAIARKLEALVRQEKGMRPVMIRDGDYFIPLRQRTEKARKHKADLFLSIHADAAAVGGAEAGGSSVYTLSERGATTEAARWLAERENSSDLIGGVSLDDKDNLLASVLLDLSQAATNEASTEVAHRILGELGQVGRVHKRQVEQAGFMVLKSPDIPSVLVETAFISNPAEEERLRDTRYQQSLARAILSGIRAYFVKRAPQGTIYAAREHVIARGDTLGQIAERYRVSADRIRAENGLNGEPQLEAGAVLRIPPNAGG